MASVFSLGKIASMSANLSEKQQEQGGTVSPSERQIQKLVEVISRSQHNYRELIDNLDQAVFTLSLDGEIRVANLHFAKIAGVSFQELIGHPLHEFIESPTVAELQALMPGFLEKGSWSGTVPIRLKNEKETRRFSCWFQSVVEHEQVSVIGWARDVTVQHESELRFTELFERLREGIFFTSPEGQILDANPAMVRIFGYDSKEELLTHNFKEMYDDPSTRPRIIRQLLDTGLQDNEIVLRRKDGKKIHCLTSGFAIRDASGKPVRLQGTIVDVTERKEMEKRLLQEKEFVRRLIDSFPDLIVVLDCEGRFTFVSERINDILGITPAEYIGRPIGQRINAVDKLKLAEMCGRVVSGSEAHAQVEIQARHADGTWRALLVTASPLFDENGKITGMVSSGRDVTESKLVEEQLARKEKFAAMGEMLAGAAHELNNPLTAILGVSDLLRERATDESTRHQVDLILKQARRAANIVQDLLALSRPLGPGRAKVDLRELVGQAVQSQQPFLTQKNIAVKMGSLDGLVPVEGDRKQLLQAFSNIVANAWQSIASARDHGTIDISFQRVDDRICVTITDDGPGIPAESISKIFDPFFTTKRPGGNSGIGLTICLAVIKEHGGTIEVRSAPMSGATFQVFLPTAAARTDPAQPADSLFQAPPVREKRSADGEILRGHTVLIVDDEEGIREVVEDGLAGRGMKVHAVESSEAALAYLANNACDIVLCDYNLPGINGNQFFQRLREQRNAPHHFVFMTGDLFDPAITAGMRAQGATVLQKPFHITALVTMLAGLLQPETSKIG
jgi:PAS domain S-box-containing protein